MAAGGFQDAEAMPRTAVHHDRLPPMLSNEACEAHMEWNSRGEQRVYGHDDHHSHHNLHWRRPRLRGEPPSLKHSSSPSPRLHQYQPRQKLIQTNINRAVNGGGMRAIFLSSCSRQSNGTGVFFPQGLDTENNNSDSFNRKPACAPVLLPTRVVQALNLNVQALGLQISPRQGGKCHKGVTQDINTSRKKRNDDTVNEKNATNCCLVSKSRSSSPHVFLPKEWTY